MFRKECEFCNLLNDKDNPTYIQEMNHGTLFLNWNQIYYGRTMYIYHTHVKDITKLNRKELIAAEEEVYQIAKCINKLVKADTMNVATLGNYIPHLHWHIIPRRKTDNNWGNPPWPHGNKFLTNLEYEQLSKDIRKYLEKNCTIHN